MEIDVTQKIYQMDGKTPFAERGEDITVRTVLCTALTARVPEPGTGIKKHAENFELALRIQRNDVVELSNPEAAMLEKLVEAHISLIAYQVVEWLEGRDPFNSSESETPPED